MSSQMSQFEPLDVKFRALLDPIKDLAANWDIDIADSLTDYLEELDGLRMSLDGQSNLNFAAAGLLIQGSTAVYSKKVEFLHQLVLQSLDQMTNSKSNSSAGHGKNKNNTISTLLDDERLLFGTDPSFLLLDDAVEEGSNINLIDVPDSSANSKERRRSSARHSISGDFSRASMVLMHSVLQEDHGGSSLRMSSCQMDSSGALQLGGWVSEKNPMLDRSLGLKVPEPESNYKVGPYPGFDALDPTEEHGGGGDDWGDDGDNNDFSLIGGDDHFGDGAHEINRINADAVQAVNRQQDEKKLAKEKKQRNALSLMDPHAVSEGAKPLKKGRANKIPKGGLFLTEINKISTHKQTITSFDFLNYGSSSSVRHIPTSGLTNKIFTQYLKELKRDEIKLKGKCSDEKEVKERPSGFYLYRGATASDDEHGRFGVDDGGDCSDEDNEGGGTGMFWDEGDQNLDNNENGNNENENRNGIQGRIIGVNNIGGDEGGAIDDIMAGQDHDDVEFEGGSPGGRICGDLDPFQDADDDLMRRVERALSDSLNDSQDTSYETICKRHIQNFMDGAQLYARETQLSQRVADWTSRLEPILRAQELAPQYDIHTYSDLVLTQVGSAASMDLERRFRVLGLSTDENSMEEDRIRVTARRASVSTNRTVVDFQEIVGERRGGEGEGRTSAEVCRVFLACLMLANAGNLDLIPPTVSNSKKATGSDKTKSTPNKKEKEYYFDPKSSFSVRLLKEKRSLDVEEFRAPSVSVSGSQ